MPSADVVKVALIVVLVAALVALIAWFISDVMPDVVSTGDAAVAGLNDGAGSAWTAVVAMFGADWALVWSLGLAISLAFAGVVFLVRFIQAVV